MTNRKTAPPSRELVTERMHARLSAGSQRSQRSEVSRVTLGSRERSGVYTPAADEEIQVRQC